MGDTSLKEKDFLYVPEFRAYLENSAKKNGKSFAPKTIKRHVINVIDFLYYSSTHNYEVELDGPDEVPIDDELIKCGKKFFTPYFYGWLDYKNGESEDSIKQSISSVKKFYMFLKETGRIDSDIAEDAIKDLIYV
ncbi:MAG: hypothetical protein LKG26_01795 [Saccharofermentans sp.]|jgi:hypothetical protein|nr:hypothetical protein [Mageeibacillus sp.]MCI1264128.1 hypothetical protein [Saccharofermentans sp.]MCI1274809.1 hypothetical protein [Saccharofermentans sp.]MCI1768639.1 hypothetical protein [Mageeibacillus sp.]